MLCMYLDPEEIPSIFILFLTEEPSLKPNGTLQLVLDLKVCRKHEHFGGLALPVKLVGA